MLAGTPCLQRMKLALSPVLLDLTYMVGIGWERKQGHNFCLVWVWHGLEIGVTAGPQHNKAPEEI